MTEPTWGQETLGAFSTATFESVIPEREAQQSSTCALNVHAHTHVHAMIDA